MRRRGEVKREAFKTRLQRPGSAHESLNKEHKIIANKVTGQTLTERKQTENTVVGGAVKGHTGGERQAIKEGRAAQR